MNFDEWNKETDSLCPRRAFDAAFNYQQKKLDCCREENKALLNRLSFYEKHIKAIKHIHETQFNEHTDTSFILGNLDGFIEYLENDLKGNTP